MAGLRGDLIVILAREIMGRPDAHLASIEMLDFHRDGFDGVRVELADAPLVLQGKRKGLPNWRKVTNRQSRLISNADLTDGAARWSARTGGCIDCTGTGQQFVRWHHIEGTTYEPCRPCGGTGNKIAAAGNGRANPTPPPHRRQP